MLVCGLRYPLHGLLHIFFLAFFAGLALAYVMFLLEKILHPLSKVQLIEFNKNLSLKSFLVAGVLGTTFHVLFDSPLYDDTHPFFPLTMNPMYNPNLSIEIYSVCVWIGIRNNILCRLTRLLSL